MEVLVIKKHLKCKRLKISANILFTCYYLFIQTWYHCYKANFCAKVYATFKKEFTFTTLLSSSFYFHASNYFNFGFHGLPSIYTSISASRIRAKHTLVSKYSTVNIILLLFICLSNETKIILKYNLNYILCLSFLFSSIHSLNASSSDTVSKNFPCTVSLNES